MSVDQAAVVRTVYEYAYGIDTRDWALYRSIFADTVHSDFSSYNGRPPATMSGDQWVAGVRPLFTGLDATQHTMTNPLVDAAGEGTDGKPCARCRVYMQAAHFLHDWADPEFTIGGYYDNDLVSTDDGWKLTAVRLTVWWRRGDPDLMVEAARRGAERLAQTGASTHALGSQPPLDV